MATSTIEANPGDSSILDDNSDPDLSLETGNDPELEAIKARVHQMDEEAAKLKKIQSEVGKQIASPVVSAPVDANPGDNSILEHNNKLNWSLEMSEDTELELIKARNLEMEAEAKKLKQIQSEVAKEMTSPVSKFFSAASVLDMSYEEKAQVDARSVYCGNVDYGATAQELEQHFHGCGGIDRVTIMCNKFDGQPKGFAYVEFADKDSVDTAMALDDSLFR